VARAKLEQERAVCESPSTLEIYQCEQRLDEHFDQNALHLEQHLRRLAALIALEKTIWLVDQKPTLLDSIHDSFVTAAGSERKRQDFHTKFTRILSNVRACLNQCYDSCEAAESAQVELEAELQLKCETSQAFAKRFTEFDSVCKSRSSDHLPSP